jgi:hypothetical protein
MLSLTFFRVGIATDQSAKWVMLAILFGIAVICQTISFLLLRFTHHYPPTRRTEVLQEPKGVDSSLVEAQTRMYSFFHLCICFFFLSLSLPSSSSILCLSLFPERERERERKSTNISLRSCSLICCPRVARVRIASHRGARKCTAGVQESGLWSKDPQAEGTAHAAHQHLCLHSSRHDGRSDGRCGKG